MMSKSRKSKSYSKRKKTTKIKSRLEQAENIGKKSNELELKTAENSQKIKESLMMEKRIK